MRPACWAKNSPILRLPVRSATLSVRMFQARKRSMSALCGAKGRASSATASRVREGRRVILGRVPRALNASSAISRKLSSSGPPTSLVPPSPR